MARFLYGGGGDGDVIKPTGVPYISATAIVYDARTGGNPVTDLQNMAGAAITQVVTDTYGQAIFYGPDMFIGVLWLDFGSGVRWGLSPKAVDLAATKAISAQRAADNAGAAFTLKAALPYNANDPLEQALTTKLDPLVIPRFSSISARDAAFPVPVAGDRCYRTDTDMEQVYQGGQAQWRNRPAMTPSSFTTTLSNTIGETSLGALVIPGNNASTGATYRIRVFGTLTALTGTSPTFNWQFRIGGVGGSRMAQSGPRTPIVAGAANRIFIIEALATCLATGTSGQWFGVQQTTEAYSGGGTGAAPYVAPTVIMDGTQPLTRDTTVSQTLTVSGQWGTADPGNICAVRGFIAERVC